MNSLKRKVSMAVAILATASAFGANAADGQQQAAPAQQAANTASTKTARAESPQFEYFEHQMTLMSAPSYTPSEHPDAKPAPKSAHRTPSVWDDPINTASFGQ
jgi:hypothetical protein